MGFSGADRVCARSNSFFQTIFLAVFLMAVAVYLPAKAEVELVLFDFDGTLVENRQVRDGSMNPPIVIYRNEQRLNLLQEESAGPKQLRISSQDLHRISEFLGTGEGRPGAVNREAVLQDGTKIRPGDYYLRMPDSFQFYREGTNGENHLLNAFSEAVHQSPEGRWKGPMWELFAKLCETEAGAQSIGIITARGHSRAEWDQLFEFMKAQGLIKFKPNVNRVFNMSRPEFDRYGGGGGSFSRELTDMAVRKSKLIEEILTQLARAKTAAGILHSVIYAEDEQPILERVAAVFRKIAFGNHTPVRMTLVNTGLKTQIRENALPEIAVIEPSDSDFRSATKESLFPKPKRASSSRGECRALFMEVP